MSPERRREMILQAALPLVAEYGAAVTTAQIARAAAIGEATIFRVFADKEELLSACVARALDPAHMLAEIAAIPLDQPLADRLREAAEAMRAYLERMGSVIGALHASGARRGRPDAGDGGGGGPVSREESFARTREAVAELFEPDRDTLRRPPEKLAAIFLGMLFVRPAARDGEAETVALDDIIEVFLNGAVA